ncbi:precorrin-6A/cobalt-precorrin-6A reductase [Clostridium algifaecis]|uniref:Precorrin-6A/cobalt-precorrin-6A reductase n=1 Tax=Clostridium algifaecis TaxID=1472040 RepID=A0ABS4KSI7_9CLOT|nr:precorrin-6A/cobalt-precorrin-6A reductase [Clostridium algifaecis]
MIGLILGTSEGRDILSNLNNFTENIFVSTATIYGGDILKDYKYAYLNNKPLDYDNFIDVLEKNNVEVLVDASHPYAVEVTKNAIKACEKLNIEYVRYERPSCMESFKNNDRVIEVKNYSELNERIKFISGNILDTTGSKNLEKILCMKLKNRIIHRVLPQVDVIEKCSKLKISIDDIIAIKGPVSYELNCAFINDYNIEAVLLKDSGARGGTYDKIKACIDCNVYAFVMVRKKIKYKNVFYNIDEMLNYIGKKYILRG